MWLNSRNYIRIVLYKIYSITINIIFTLWHKCLNILHYFRFPNLYRVYLNKSVIWLIRKEIIRLSIINPELRYDRKVNITCDRVSNILSYNKSSYNSYTTDSWLKNFKQIKKNANVLVNQIKKNDIRKFKNKKVKPLRYYKKKIV